MLKDSVGPGPDLVSKVFSLRQNKMKTSWISESDIERKWYVVDIDDKVLGRAATQIAELLIGKSKVNRVPNMDCGDYVIVINASKVKVTGNKRVDKLYYHHSGYPGGLKVETFDDVMAKNPSKVISLAVKNMLPNNKLRQKMMIRLFIYEGSEHLHNAQKPEKVEIKS